MDMPEVLSVETNTFLVIHTLGARDSVQDFKNLGIEIVVFRVNFHKPLG